jgi:hypothetical protein
MGYNGVFRLKNHKLAFQLFIHPKSKRMKISTFILALCLGCLISSPGLIAQNYVNFTINQPAAPSASFSYTVQNTTYSFTDLSSGNGLTYSWTFGDGNTSTLQNPVHTYATDGSYTICLAITDPNNCTSNSCDSATVVGIQQAIPGLTFEVAPNPFSGQTSVNYVLTEAADISISVYNLLGAKVQTVVAGPQAAGNYQQRIGAGLAAGSYLLVFEAEGKQLSRRIVKAQ